MLNYLRILDLEGIVHKFYEFDIMVALYAANSLIKEFYRMALPLLMVIILLILNNRKN